VENLRTVLIWIHIIAGSIGLIVFWIPIFSKKGGAVHLILGALFVYCSYLVGFSALTISITKLLFSEQWATDVLKTTKPLENAIAGIRSSAIFLGYLSVVGLTSTRHAIHVIRSRKDPPGSPSRLHQFFLACCVASSVVVIAYGLFFASFMKPLFFAMSPIGLLVGIGGLRFLQNPTKTPMAWWYEHMGAILGAGIAFHTAFLVFGVNRFVNLGFNGPLAMLPWIAPTIIGAPAIFFWTRFYQKKFGEL
jgi:hypothetical protein